MTLERRELTCEGRAISQMHSEQRYRLTMNTIYNELESIYTFVHRKLFPIYTIQSIALYAYSTLYSIAILPGDNAK